jgi:quinoprotein dehydrogenase-associated probable ABC transporter substrate-binding protein
MNAPARQIACACACWLACAGAQAGADTRPDTPAVLRVCADPNNLPFSNAAGEGFENRLAQMVAAELGARVETTWWAQQRGFVRNTVGKGLCDVVMGVPAGYGPLLTTAPYYRSGYVLVYRQGRHAPPASLDDPRLRSMKIGVHLIGESPPPPAVALARRGIIGNVVGYALPGDYRQPNPPARLIEAVARGDVDVALAWGPLAGYFSRQDPHELALAPLPADDAGLPFRFAISIGVRKGDAPLRDRLDRALVALRPRIQALLADYGVPVFTAAGGPDGPAVKETR